MKNLFYIKKKQTFISFFLITICFVFSTFSTFAQSEYSNRKFQFLSFEKIPTWVGVAVDWNQEQPAIHLYDYEKYKGHAQYISVGLKTGITFKQFKENVKNPVNRKYLPFFLHDLRETPIIIDGLSYEWAVRIEDYQYQDNPQQMAETALKLMKTVAGYIQVQSGKLSRGIIILASDPKATPNTTIAGIMNKNGYPNMTLNQLLNKIDGKKVEILNPGTCIGYLKFVAADQESTFRPSIHDILIYEKMPKRVPPVTGIITLEAQTPLSHINLLAKNRGTINLYAVDLKYLPGAESLMNKLVKITCSETKISITESTELEAIKFWNSRIQKIDIPLPDSSLKKLVDLSSSPSTFQTTSQIGAKASNYAVIRQTFPENVKKGYAIPFAYYFNTLKSCGADSMIRELLKQKPGADARNLQLEQIRNRIQNAHVNAECIDEIYKTISEQFAGSTVRLRSSTNCEDLPEFNGAGLYISKSFRVDEGKAKLEKKMLQIYASLWSSLAFEEREFYFIDHAKAGMAILINEAFPKEYANGVVLTIPDKDKLSVLINTQFGESSVTNPENGVITESIVFPLASDSLFEVKTHSSVQDIFLKDSLKNQLFELKTLSLEIHKSLTKNLNQSTDFGVDIEFKLVNEEGVIKLYLKQARLMRQVSPE